MVASVNCDIKTKTKYHHPQNKDHFAQQWKLGTLLEHQAETPKMEINLTEPNITQAATRPQDTEKKAMCIHPLTIFTCGHTLVIHPAVLPCPLARQFQPCTLRGHPYTSRLVAQTCAACTITDEARKKRIEIVGQGLLVDVKIDGAKWKVAYGSVRPDAPVRRRSGIRRVADVQWEGRGMVFELVAKINAKTGAGQ